MLQRLVSPFREFGILAGTAYVIDQLLSRVSGQLRLHFYELMVQPVPADPLIPERFTKNLTFRLIPQGDEAVERMPARAEIKQARFENGAVCLGAYRNDELTGYIWFAFGTYDEDEVRCVFELSPADQSVFDFDVYLFPDHRMGLAFVCLWDGANRFLRERGIRWSFSRVSRFNLASRRAHDRLGSCCIGKALFLKVWPLELMFSTVSPYVHGSLRRSGPVRLKLGVDASGHGGA